MYVLLSLLPCVHDLCLLLLLAMLTICFLVQSERYWQVLVKKSLQKMFPGMLTPEEEAVSAQLRWGTTSYKLVHTRITQMKMINISEDLVHTLWKNPTT